MAKGKAPEQDLAATKFNIKLGNKVYVVNFGTSTFIRIKEQKPSLTTAFHVMEEVVTLEAIPFLIYCGIKPEERDWTSFDEFLEAYDDCEDEGAISKTIPAYIAALGKVTKKLTPALETVNKMQESATQ